MGLLQVVVYSAAAKLECQADLDKETQNQPTNEEASEDAEKNPAVPEPESNQEDTPSVAESSSGPGKKSVDVYTVFLQLPQLDLRNLCTLLGREGYF